jgi:3',5'-cyclic AMP phosphodiesterase CpdA
MTVVPALAHLSDLHLGASPEFEEAARALVADLTPRTSCHVVITGDITESGSRAEAEVFERVFAPLLAARRVTIVPGNHDLVGEGVGRAFMRRRVEVETPPGLWLVRVDTTAAHNRSYFASGGQLEESQIEEITAALREAPSERLRVVLMHHHPLPLPMECIQERISTFFGWPHANELVLGKSLLARALGHCDLVLHGHRHVPSRLTRYAPNGRTLFVSNAGSSTERCAYTLYRHRGGRLADAGLIELQHAPPRPPHPLRSLMTAVSTSGLRLF